MTSQMQTPTTSGYPSESPVGMNDEEEIRRIGLAMNESQGIGEVLYDETDLVELGFRPE